MKKLKSSIDQISRMGYKNSNWNILQKNELFLHILARLTDKIPNYIENPPAKQKISENGKPMTDVSKLLDSLEV